MKALNKIFIAAITATAMTACNNELSEQIASNQGGDVKFTMGIEGTSASRVAMEDGSYQASFESTNAVGIFVKEVDSYSNLEYTYNGNAWTGATVNVPADGVYTYYAYYPYAASATSTAIAAEVSADQETGGYLANDYLMANYLTATPGQANVDLQFTHALSLVEVTLSGPNAAEDAVVTLSNMITDATMNLEASTVTPGEKKANVTMDKLTTSMKYRAIVPEQTVTMGTALMTIASKGRTYKVSYKESDVKFEKGKYISLNVELGSSSSAEDVTVTITSQGITDWKEGTGVTGNSTIDEVPLIPEFGETISAMGTNDVIKLENSSWFGILADANSLGFSAEIKPVEDAGNITPEWSKQANLTFISKWTDKGDGTGSSNTNNWYTAVLGYFYKGVIYTGNTFKYKLSFKAKGCVKVGDDLTVSEEDKAKLYVTCRNGLVDEGDVKKAASFAIMNNATSEPTSTNSTKDVTNEWAEYAFYIYFNKKLTGSPSSLGSKSWEETSVEDYQNIQIRICSYDTKATVDVTSKQAEISITDVKLEEYTE